MTAQPPATRAEPIDPKLLNLAALAMRNLGPADQITVVHEALVAVLPAHEAMVRTATATICEHSQLIPLGSALDAVMVEVQPELDRRDVDSEGHLEAMRVVIERNVELLRRAEQAEAVLREILDAFHIGYNDDGEMLGAVFRNAVSPDDYQRWRAAADQPAKEGQ